MLENIEVLIHSSIKINKGKVIYIDPYKIDKEYNDADFIFITHSHYDHFSEKDIIKVIKNNTTVIIPEELMKKVLKLGVSQENIIPVEPNECEIFEDIKFETIPAYNINKPFHKKENGWVGYIIKLKGIRYYIAGDTDITEENQKVQCDVAFVPVAGTYTMDYKEAAKLVNTIKPKVAIPIHYGDIVYFESDRKHIKIICSDGTERIFVGKLVELIDKLPFNYVMVAQSFIINVRHIRMFKKDSCIMDNGDCINIGRKYKDAFNIKMIEYNKRGGNG